MFVLGNLLYENNVSFIIVISSKELNGYTYFDKTNVTNSVTIFRYKIEIKANENIQIGKKNIYIPSKRPCLENTSIYFLSCDGVNGFEYTYPNIYVGPLKLYNIKNKQKDYDMWKKLYMDLKNDNNDYKYVVHIGDQVYMDDANYEVNLLDVQKNDNKIKKIYYSEYKKNYNKKYKKKVLESAFNVMIQDDHEFTDNYGVVSNKKLDLSKKMLKYLDLMYVTFQENLYGINSHNKIIKHLQFDDFQIIIPNIRKYRNTSNKNAKFPVMGKKQIEEFDNIVSNTSKNIKKTIYVNTIPFASVNKYVDILYTIVTKKSIYKEEYYFSIPSYREERKYILNKLFHLDNVVIVSGDNHLADHHILKKNKKEISQIVTSPISSNPLFYISSSRYINSVSKAFGTIINKYLYERKFDNIKVKKEWFVNDFNYLKITNEKAMLKCFLKENNKVIEI